MGWLDPDPRYAAEAEAGARTERERIRTQVLKEPEMTTEQKRLYDVYLKAKELEKYWAHEGAVADGLCKPPEVIIRCQAEEDAARTAATAAHTAWIIEMSKI